MIKLLSLKRMSRLLFFTVLVLMQYTVYSQVSFNASGSWTSFISSNLEAGSNFSSGYTSSSNQVYISATTTKGKGKAGNFGWNVSVHKEDSNWHSSLGLSVRRTGSGNSTSNGNGGGLIQGGTAFQGLSGTTSAFFSGKKGHTDIPIQYQVTGVSVLIPSGVYSTTVVFTLTDQ